MNYLIDAKWHTFHTFSSFNQDFSYNQWYAIFNDVLSFSVLPKIIQLKIVGILDLIKYVHVFVYF